MSTLNTRKLMSLEAIESRTLRSATPAAEWQNFDLNHDGTINAADIMVVDSGDYNGDGVNNDNDFGVADALGGTDRMYVTIELASNVGFQYFSEEAPAPIQADPLDLNYDGVVNDADVIIVDTGDLNGDDISYGDADLNVADAHGGWEQLYNDLYARIESNSHPAEATAPETDPLDLNHDGTVNDADVIIVDTGDLNGDEISWGRDDIAIAETFGGWESVYNALDHSINGTGRVICYFS